MFFHAFLFFCGRLTALDFLFFFFDLFRRFSERILNRADFFKHGEADRTLRAYKIQFEQGVALLALCTEILRCAGNGQSVSPSFNKSLIVVVPGFFMFFPWLLLFAKKAITYASILLDGFDAVVPN
jgi:hypothetical protein